MLNTGFRVVLLLVGVGVCVSPAGAQPLERPEGIVFQEHEPQTTTAQFPRKSNWPPPARFFVIVGVLAALGLIATLFPEAYRSFIWRWYSRCGWRPDPNNRWQSAFLYRLSGISMILAAIGMLLLVYFMR